MAKANILFIQGAGAGAHDEDRPLADFVRSVAAGACDVAYPRIEGLEHIEWSRTREELERALFDLEEGGRIVAHSLGGAAILKLLSEGQAKQPVGGLFLIATPYKGKDGEWGTDDFAIDPDFATHLPDCGDIRLYHSTDDEFVPVAHARLYGDKIRHATVIILDGYGHQFSSKPFEELADDLRR